MEAQAKVGKPPRLAQEVLDQYVGKGSAAGGHAELLSVRQAEDPHLALPEPLDPDVSRHLTSVGRGPLSPLQREEPPIVFPDDGSHNCTEIE